MDLEELSDFVGSLPGAAEEQPFGPNVDVFKVGGKIFAILSPDDIPGAISLKCDPVEAEELRDRFAAVTPGYHLNKRHWNTVILDGSIPDELVRAMVARSYGSVVAGLPRSVREQIAHHH
jgi:predicted DNA-binding protein (MmcQ/YjbR family)